MNKNKKFNDSKKKMTEENIKLRIDGEVMRRQLISVRNTINEILGDKAVIPDGIKHFLETYYKGLVDLKDIEKIHHPTEQEWAEAKKHNEELAKSERSRGKEFVESDKVNLKISRQEQAMFDQQETANNQPKPSKCHNCQTLGIYKKGFCFKCINEGKTDIKDVKFTPEQSTFKCSKCGTEGDDEGSFKTRNGKVFCLDCIGGEVGFKPNKK